MPVVSDTSPLLCLSAIDRLDLLQRQFSDVVVPDAVVAELRISEPRPGSEGLRRAFEEGWLRRRAVSDSALVRLLMRDLDEGESAAIALAEEVRADRVLLDERAGRAIAKRLGLSVTGTLGVLLRARREGHLSSLTDAIHDLRSKLGFFVSAELEERLRLEAGE